MCIRDRNRLSDKADPARIGAASPPYRLLVADTEFAGQLHGVFHEHRIGYIALVHAADLNAVFHSSLGLGGGKEKVIRRGTLKQDSQVRLHHLGGYGGTSHSHFLLGRKSAHHIHGQLIPAVIYLIHGIHDAGAAGPVVKCLAEAEQMCIRDRCICTFHIPISQRA